MKGVDQRAVPVGVTPVSLCAENPSRVAVQVGAPLGAAGAWVSLLWNLDPTAVTGMPHFFGDRPLLFAAADYG